jgi:hypothetical protein
MNMSDLSLTQPERHSSEPVRRNGNSFPRAHNSSDSFFGTTNSHSLMINLQKKKSCASDILDVGLQRHTVQAAHQLTESKGEQENSDPSLNELHVGNVALRTAAFVVTRFGCGNSVSKPQLARRGDKCP